MLTLADEVQRMDALLEEKDQQLIGLRRDRVEQLTIREVNNIHSWYVVILEKELGYANSGTVTQGSVL